MVKIIHPEDRDSGTSQTSGMKREAGVASETTDSKGLWMGVGKNDPGVASGVHHHGEYESGIYILEGSIRFRWGDNLEHVQDTSPGDFVFVPPFEVHMEENLDPDNEAVFLLARNGIEGIVVNVPDPREQ
jgi:uncharacterized RmlC-like cupin family protein